MNTLTKTHNGHNVSRPSLMRDFFDVENFFEPSSWLRSAGRSFPAVNLSENDKNFMVDIVAPGFKKEDFKVNMDEDNMLTISAETKKEETDENKEYSRREYSYSSFTRSFNIPDNAKGD